MRELDLLAATLVVIGGLNRGLVAVAKFDLVGIVSLLVSARRPRAHAAPAGAR